MSFLIKFPAHQILAAKNTYDQSFYKDLKGKRKASIDKALEKAGDAKLTKAIKSNKWTMAKAGDYLEDINYHAMAALFRKDKGTDADSLLHGEDAHDRIDLGSGEEYGGERDGMMAMKYEAGGNNRDNWDDEQVDTDIWGHRIKDRKVRAAIYMEHHKLQKNPTYKKIMTHIEKHKDKYKKHVKDLVASYKKRAEKVKKSEDFDPKMRELISKDYLENAKKAEDFGKKHDLI